FGKLRRILRKFGRVEFVALRTEFATDLDAAVLYAVCDLLRSKAFQDRPDPLARAGAVVDDSQAFIDAYAMLVEQTVEKPLRAHRRVDQLRRLDRRQQRQGFLPGRIGGMIAAAPLVAVASRKVRHAPALG